MVRREAGKGQTPPPGRGRLACESIRIGRTQRQEFQSIFHSPSISLDHSPLAELHATKISRNNDNNISNTTMFKYSQHRPARCTMRLTIIA